ncbi:hypothetical protein FY034_13365 [Trichlorobacter lovleyi]|uniref:hypothetical protein n=1 Tax=Trichlorobacter lovleyi TaxID=313985 RepID=UPI00223F2F27|nr:hypothetical protein [Trichlorobacter lovleyi]QOX79879.1 hypothetical protein FY034_13365 [Trichlorobacter lovleyi]
MRTITVGQIRWFLFIGYCLVLALLAWYDQPLSPEARTLLQRPESGVAESKNAYPYMIGMNFPAASDPAAEGQEVVDWYRTTLLQKKKFTDFYQYPPEYEQKRSALKVNGRPPGFHDNDKSGRLLEFVAKNPQKVSDLLRSNELLLNRYRRLLTFSQYYEPLELGIWMPLPSTSATLDLHRLYLLNLGQQSHNGNSDAAVQGVKQVMAFWLAIANADTSLMMKFHAFSALRSSLYLVSELSGLPGLTGEKREELTQALQFGASQWQTADVLRSEAIWAERTMATFRMLAKASHNPVDWLLLAWLKPNAMANQLYTQYRHDQHVASLTAPALADYIKKQSGVSPIQVRKLDLTFVYNPLGEAQAIKSYNLQYSGYARKVHDLEGMRRLAQLTQKASEKRVTPEGMKAFLATSGPDLNNPYTGLPMSWNADTKSIWFASPGSEKPVEMRVF